MLNGVVDDPAFLPIIYGMDEDDDWENEDNWRAVNPSMDTIFSFESFEKDFLEAKEMPHKQNLFRRLRLNQWTRQETRYLPMDKWLACHVSTRYRGVARGIMLHGPRFGDGNGRCRARIALPAL